TLGDWALQILFVRGAFDLAAAKAAAAILAAYALGLVSALALRSLVAGFHGRGDTRTPLRLLVAATVVNIGLKILLAPALGAVGLAFATSAGLTLYAALLFRAGRVRGFLKGPSPKAAMVVLGTGVALGLIILWSRDAALRAVETVTGAGWALPIAFLVLVFAALIVQGLVTVRVLGRGAFAGQDRPGG
ncbi:MAG: polysaccharide biosynthesis C-terminal domain-containing protein, partial [Roseovarius sp.]|uniref:lipid II flippase MurJ n=1 Tax=Roseovarius sp. TaxID=1486281 RepID=UPI001B7BD7CA